jgi:putative ABC transport system permease protein
MEFFEVASESLRTLLVNKLRTGLAVLGIVIGISSVIALISLGQASQKAVETQIQSLGANLLTVNPGSVRSGAVRGAQGGATTLTLEDAKAILQSPEITTIKQVSPEVSRRSQVVTGNANTNSQIVGVTAVYAGVHNTAVEIGEFITENHNESLARVAVLGPQVVTNLFGENADPLGQTIRINGQALTVIGVTVAKGGSGFQNQDDVVYVPLSIAQKLLFGVVSLSSIALQANDAESMSRARDEVGYFLLARHKLTDPTMADFSIFSQQDLLNTVASTTGVFTTLLSGVAAISLLVGGIGIMNIMLVTVTERTREIGLRKALGAKKKDIITQFLIEAVLLTFVGGLIGVVCGIIASFVISRITNSPFVVSVPSIGLAFGVSVIIGIVFGWYPAKRASDLQPIEALRFE